jgi:hypothetical protein
MRIANGIAALIFSYSIYLQLNDPDPLLWVLYYLVAVVFCALGAAGIYTWFVGVVALAYFLGVAYFMPGWSFETVALLKEPKMHSDSVELAREAFGLFLCGLWMSVLMIAWYRRRGGEAAGEACKAGAEER